MRAKTGAFFSTAAFVHEVTHGPESFNVSTTHTVTGYEAHAIGVPYTSAEHHVKRAHEEAIRARVLEELDVTDGSLEGAVLSTSKGDVTELRHAPTGVFVRGVARGAEERRELLDRLVEALWGREV